MQDFQHMQGTRQRTRQWTLDTPLTALFNINLEVLLWLGIILFAAVTRFWDLGSRSYNHDESLHTLYSWYLYQGRGYKHDPMMHGPFQFHANALIYFLFGDNDYTGRILYAVFGVLGVTLPLLLRRWLGRAGALCAALFIAIAPDIMYYSRFARNDILHLVWSLLAIIGLFGFLATRRARYFVLGAAAISLMWATKEVVFIFGFSAFTFLLLVFILEYLRRGNWGLTEAIRSVDAGTWTIAITSALAIFVVLYTTFFTNIDGLRSGAVGAVEYWLAQQEVKRGDQPWYYYLILVPLYDFMPLLAALMGVGYYAIRRNTASLSFGVAAPLALATAYALWGRPTNPDAVSNVPAIAGWLMLSIAVFALIRAVRLFMQGKRSDVVILVFGVAGFVLARLILADVVSLKPIILAAAEGQRKPLAIDPGVILFLLIIGWAVVSLMLAALKGRGNHPLFTAFVIHWLFTSFIIYSWAGEKMPWLALHMSLPAIVLGAKFLNDLWARVDWGAVRQRGGLAFALLLPVIGYTLLRVFLVAPFQGISIQKIDATLQWFTAVIIGGVLIYLAYRAARRLTRGEVLQVAFATLMAVLGTLTLRASFMGAFEHGDVAVEMLIYAQGAPDVPDVVRDIETLSEKLTGGKDLEIVVESSETWPFAWYLRDYKRVAFPANLEGPPNAPVVVAAYENEARYKPWMSNYVGVKRKLIWWFAEDYKGLTWERIFDLLGNAKNRESLLNFLFYRKFETPLGQWPLRKEFTFYVRRDVASLVWTPSQLPPPEVERPDKELQDKFVSVNAKLIIGQRGQGEGQLTAPKGVFAAPDGSLYVADAGNHRVQKLDANGKFVLSLGGQGTAPGEMQEPWAVAVAPDGSLYVADTWNHRIQKFDANGRFLLHWGQFGDTGGQSGLERALFFYGPRAIAVDAQGNVWVVDTGNKRAVKFDPNGKPLGVYGGVGTGPGQFAEPVGIAISAKSGDIFIADTWNRRIQRFDKDFQPKAQWSVIGWDTTSVVNKPYLALDNADNLYVTDPENQRVLKYSSDGKLLAYFGKFGADASSFNLPTGITVDTQGNVIIADSFNNRLMKFEAINK